MAIPTKDEQEKAEADAREDGKKQQEKLDNIDKPDKPTPMVTPAGSSQAFQPKQPETKPGEAKLGMIGSKV